METMTKPSLREQIQTRHVRYRLNNVAVLCLQKPKEVPVMRDGVQHMHKEPAIFITRIGDGKMGPFTEQFDITEESVREYVDFVDAWIARNPRGAAQAGLAKLNDERPPARIQNWDNMSAEQIRTVLDATRIDLTWAMEYELLRPDTIFDLAGQEATGGPREEVIDLIEDLWANGFSKAIDESDEAPDLS